MCVLLHDKVFLRDMTSETEGGPRPTGAPSLYRSMPITIFNCSHTYIDNVSHIDFKWLLLFFVYILICKNIYDRVTLWEFRKQT